MSREKERTNHKIFGVTTVVYDKMESESGGVHANRQRRNAIRLEKVKAAQLVQCAFLDRMFELQV
jgi:hypothetical protein